MTLTLLEDNQDAIARGLVEVDHLDHEAKLWRELADFLAEPLALHNLLAEPVNQTSDDSVEVRWQNVTRAMWVPAVPFHHRDTALDTLGDRVRASIEPENYCKWHDLFDCPYAHAPDEREDGPEPRPEHALADVAPRRGGKYRADRPGWLQRLRDAWADETGDKK